MKKLLCILAAAFLLITVGCDGRVNDENIIITPPTETPDNGSESPKEEDKNDEGKEEDKDDNINDDVVTENTYEENMPEPSYDGLAHVSYSESDEIFANPERGFYKHFDFKSASDSPLSASTLKSNRVNGIALCYTGYYLTKYIKSDIADDFLNLLRKNMQALRDGGAKCLLRFAYTTDASNSNKSNWDAKPEYVQRHIASLKPIIQEYSDVILCWQAGFVGVWGEWYYTNNFVFDPQTPEQHALRKEVIDAMLDALPADRSVALRTPMFKRMMYAQSYTDTLTYKTAYNGSAKARLCAFNDCFGAAADDYGTFIGNDTRTYWKKDTRYVLMGGETCNVSEYCTCEKSLKDMEDYHWTYLNSGYNSDVLNRWEKNGCMNEVKRRLGYRLSVADVYYSDPAAGKDMQVILRIKNTGFAAPMNPRGVELVLVDGSGKKTVYAFNDVDPRFWFANKTSIVNQTITLPADASGKCTLYLNLPDPKPTLHDNAAFSIRLANKDAWDSNTGYNKVLEFKL